jgi:hypothetical protein
MTPNIMKNTTKAVMLAVGNEIWHLSGEPHIHTEKPDNPLVEYISHSVYTYSTNTASAMTEIFRNGNLGETKN